MREGKVEKISGLVQEKIGRFKKAPLYRHFNSALQIRIATGGYSLLGTGR